MDATWLDKLNPQQRQAVTHGNGPLLIIAGAGTGKTATLAGRVAWLVHEGMDPGRILLLTFSRRAAAEMLRRVRSILAGAAPAGADAQVARVWGGTFHAIANRILRLYASALGLGADFTVIDRSDAEDLMHLVRSNLGLDKADARFPRKATCMAIYSRCLNAQEPVEAALEKHFPWCAQYPDRLKRLFLEYAQAKQRQNLLDYDDLLLYWRHMLDEPAIAADMRLRFDAVLVDEYQDTNAVQAAILKALKPDGTGLTVVGDDAQAIYSFRAATVRNILDFPKDFPGAAVLKLEENYRSVQPILDAANVVIEAAGERFAKNLFSRRASDQKPRLVNVLDEDQQSAYVIEQALANLEAGIPLRRQAVLFRAAHHSDALEVELSRRNIPFVKYGGLKFLEAAHVKDALSYLRLAENPRDQTAALRALGLLDGFGPAACRRALEHLAGAGFDVVRWAGFAAPAAAVEQWPALMAMLRRLRHDSPPLPEQIAEVRRFYSPILERRYDHAHLRARDLEQLEHISGNYESRGRFLAELTLDPPNSTQDLAGEPLREEDWLVLSTIHSAKGLEWDVVFVVHAADGNIPSDMASGSAEEVEEERRLFYVALTRAKDQLHVVFPLKYYHKNRRTSDRHSYAQLTRFITDEALERFERVAKADPQAAEPRVELSVAQDIRKRIAGMWA